VVLEVRSLLWEKVWRQQKGRLLHGKRRPQLSAMVGPKTGKGQPRSGEGARRNAVGFANKTQAETLRFPVQLPAGMPKVVARLMRDVVFGVESLRSVFLRGSGPVPWVRRGGWKVIGRLGRQLGRAEWREKVQHDLVGLGPEEMEIVEPPLRQGHEFQGKGVRRSKPARWGG